MKSNSENQEKDIKQQPLSFSDFNLDNRIVRAITKLSWPCPTLVQTELFKMCTMGKSVICRAKTGSGKTGAYLLPMITKILKNNKSTNLIIAPTKELCEQINSQIKKLCSYFESDSLSVLNLNVTPLDSDKADQQLFNIIVGTPDKVYDLHSKNSSRFSHESYSKFDYFVIDEADLIFSFGYQKTIKEILSSNRFKAHQHLLISATVNKDILELNKVVLKELHLLDLQDPQIDPSNIVEYTIPYNKNDNFLILYYILKLEHIKGKSIVFVNDISQCYRLKLFLSSFGISSCILYSQLPFMSRYDIVQQFNNDIVDMIIAVDENPTNTEKEPKEKSGEEDMHYGASRGVDFKNASYVINFDTPLDYDSYVHRIGRTARANQTGVAITFCQSTQKKLFDEIKSARADRGYETKDYDFENIKDQIEGFRYRVSDVLTSITKNLIHNTRIEELKKEIKNSEKIKELYLKNGNMDYEKFQTKIDHLFDQKKKIVSNPQHPNGDVAKKLSYLHKKKRFFKAGGNQHEFKQYSGDIEQPPKKAKTITKFIKPPTGKVKFMSKRNLKKLTNNPLQNHSLEENGEFFSKDDKSDE